MRMFIPEIGTRLTLEEDWKFTLHKERRNDTVWEKLRVAYPDAFARIDAEMIVARDLWLEYLSRPVSRDPDTRERNTEQLQAHNVYMQNIEKFDITLPAGTELTIDRLYIRKGISDYSSVSFNLNATSHEALNVKGRKRFWAKIQDVNRIEYEPPLDPEASADEGLSL